MDFSDHATLQEELMRELALKRAANHAPALPAVGACHWCDASVPDGHRFCDCDCRDDQETNHQAQLTQQANCASAGSLLVQVYCKRAGPFCTFQGAGQFERMIFLGCGFSTY